MQSILPSFKVIRDAFIASVNVTRCVVPNADLKLPQRPQSTSHSSPEGESLKAGGRGNRFVWYTLSFHHWFKTWKDERRGKKGSGFMRFEGAPRTLMLGTARGYGGWALRWVIGSQGPKPKSPKPPKP
jgi:hypothetical protein